MAVFGYLMAPANGFHCAAYRAGRIPGLGGLWRRSDRYLDHPGRYRYRGAEPARHGSR